MLKHYVADFQDKSHSINRLEVHAHEMSMYLVKLQLTPNQEAGYLYTDEARLAHFRSTQHIRDLFSECDVLQAVMIHDSPYDEMIGNPAKSHLVTEIPFHI